MGATLGPALQHNQVIQLCVARHVLHALLTDHTEYVRATRKRIRAATCSSSSILTLGF